MVLKSETPYCQAVLRLYRLFEFLQYLIKTLKGCRLWFRLLLFFLHVFSLIVSLLPLLLAISHFLFMSYPKLLQCDLALSLPIDRRKKNHTTLLCCLCLSHICVFNSFLFLSPLDASSCLFPLCSHCVCSDTHNLFFLCSTFFFFLCFTKRLLFLILLDEDFNTLRVDRPADIFPCVLSPKMCSVCFFLTPVLFTFAGFVSVLTLILLC